MILMLKISQQLLFSDRVVLKNMIDMLNSLFFGISLLAIVIDVVGIVNTMLMSVVERTREFVF